MGMPRMHEDLTGEGETASPNRIARLMARNGLSGIPQRRSSRKKRNGARPVHVINRFERDFSAAEPNTKWVRHHIHTHRSGMVVPVHRARSVQPQDRRLIDVRCPSSPSRPRRRVDGVLAAIQPRSGGILNGWGTQVTCSDYQRFLLDRNVIGRATSGIAPTTQQRRDSSG